MLSDTSKDVDVEGIEGIEEKTVVYIGNDNSYFEKIQNRFESYYEQEMFNFEKHHVKSAEESRRLFVKLIEKLPDIIYIDFSFHLQTYLNLVYVIRQNIYTQHIPIVGLINTRAILEDSVSSGVHFTHMKCGEHHDVIYDPYTLAFPYECQTITFTMAQPMKEVNIINSFKIHYITPIYIRCEGDINLDLGEIIKLETAIPKATLPSSHYRVKKIYTEDLYYNSRYGFDLEFLYLDKPKLEKDNSARGDIREKMVDYKLQLKRTKKRVHDWVLDNISGILENKIKILILDKDAWILSEDQVPQVPIGDLPFSIHCQTALTPKNLWPIEKLKPHIISFQFNKEREEKSDLQTLVTIVKKIMSIPEYRPFIVLFGNDKINSTEFQENYKYSQMISHSSNFKLETLAEMAKILQHKKEEEREDLIRNRVKQLKKKNPTKYKNLTRDDFIDQKFYIKPSHPLGKASCFHPITIHQINETEIFFTTNAKLEFGSFSMDFPIKMNIRLAPIIHDSKKYQYRGLIHSIGEEEKKALRQYINAEVFKEKKSASQ